MKKTDIAMVILIATISVLAAFFITKAVVGTPSTDTKKAQTIEAIDPTIEQPDTAIFNSEAINPAIKIELNDDTN